eukprot:6536993-Alexandrium_andersonii.AAC.1
MKLGRGSSGSPWAAEDVQPVGGDVLLGWGCTAGESLGSVVEELPERGASAQRALARVSCGH